MRWLAVLMSPLLTVGSLYASCGLSACDVVQRSQGLRWEMETRVSRVAYDLKEAKGSYLQAATVVAYDLAPWRFGGTASTISNSPEKGHHKTGLGNPVLRGERTFGPWSAGALIELPLGDDSHGLADDHLAAVPYMAWRGEVGGWRLDLRAGYSRSFSGPGPHSDDMAGGQHAHGLLVNPHEDREFVYRATMERRLARAEFAVLFEGQHVLDEKTEQTGFLTTGVSMDVPWGDGWTVGILAEAPAVRPHRLENRFSARISKGF